MYYHNVQNYDERSTGPVFFQNYFDNEIAFVRVILNCIVIDIKIFLDPF